MRILKKKLAKAKQSELWRNRAQQEEEDYQDYSDFPEVKKEEELSLGMESSDNTQSASNIKKTSRSKRQSDDSPKDRAPRGATSAKNIVKNYGRALANFASSNLAIPYLTDLVRIENFKVKDFRRFMASKKKQSRCIKGLRDLLIVQEEDNPTIATFKRVFKEISIIFIKYFSVNWIFGGKLCDKMTHLKYRFKIQRRIQDPEHFTYLKGFS